MASRTNTEPYLAAVKKACYPTSSVSGFFQSHSAEVGWVSGLQLHQTSKWRALFPPPHPTPLHKSMTINEGAQGERRHWCASALFMPKIKALKQKCVTYVHINSFSLKGQFLLTSKNTFGSSERGRQRCARSSYRETWVLEVARMHYERKRGSGAAELDDSTWGTTGWKR